MVASKAADGGGSLLVIADRVEAPRTERGRITANTLGLVVVPPRRRLDPLPIPLRPGGGEAGGAGTAVTEASTTAIWTLNPDGIVASGQRFALDRMQVLADALALQKTRHVLIILRPEVPVQNVATVLELLSAQGIGSVQIAEAPALAGGRP